VDGVETPGLRDFKGLFTAFGGYVDGLWKNAKTGD
jgi:hypothetical protein